MVGYVVVLASCCSVENPLLHSHCSQQNQQNHESHLNPQKPPKPTKLTKLRFPYCSVIRIEEQGVLWEEHRYSGVDILTTWVVSFPDKKTRICSSASHATAATLLEVCRANKLQSTVTLKALCKAKRRENLTAISQAQDHVGHSAEFPPEAGIQEP